MTPYYEQDGITIYHGDCREVLPQIEAFADLVLTDPPYAVSQPGVRHVGRPGKGTRNLDFFTGDGDWRTMTRLVIEALALSLDRLSTDGSIYAYVGHRQFGPLVDLLEVRGFNTRFLVWAKECPSPPPPGAGWPSGAELCVYGWRPGRIWNHRGTNTPRSNVLTADSYRYGQPGKVDHPTQKPPHVVVPLVRASSRPNSLILDPFMGSGTIVRAAKDLGRRAIGIEIEERYCEIAARRLAQQVLPFEEAA